MIVLSNDGDADLVWHAEDATVDPPNGTLAPHAKVTLSVQIPKQSIGQHSTIDVKITTNDPQKLALVVPIDVSSDGAEIVVDKTVLDFGVMPVGVATPPLVISAKNDGNEIGTLTTAAPEGFSISWAQPTIAPGATVDGKVVYQPKKIGLDVVGMTLSVPNQCGDSPTIALKGIATDGVVGITPGTIDFGLVGCGTKNQTSKVTVFNVSKQPFDATTMVGMDSLFTVAPTPTTIPPESSVEIVVGMPIVPSTAPLLKDYFKGSLTIATTAPKDTPHDVPIVASPAGGLIVLPQPADLDFGHRDALASPVWKTFAIQNLGNMAVTVDAPVPAPFSRTPIAIAPGTTDSISVQYTPRFEDVGSDVVQKIELTSADPICGAFPIGIQASVHTYEKVVHAAAPYSAPSYEHACAVGASGHVYCWGSNNEGALGSFGPATYSPRLVQTLSDAKTVAVDYSRSCATTSAGKVLCWGYDGDGHLGDKGQLGWSDVPIQIGGINDAVSVTLDGYHACALRQSGKVTCWGDVGYLGDGSSVSQQLSGPVDVSNLSDAIDLDLLHGLSCAARKNGATVVCWGNDANTQFAAQGFDWAPSPVAIPGTGGAIEVSTSVPGACKVDGGGGVYCWGGHPSGNDTNYVISEDGNIKSGLSARDRNRCGINSNQVYCYGDGAFGALGNGTTQATAGFVRSGTFVSVGRDLTFAIDNGALWQWGTPLGSNTIVKPQRVSGFDP